MSAPQLPAHILDALVRQFQAWADLWLPEDGQPSSPAAEQPASAENTPPAHWPPHSSGPPAHWVELVRAKSPGLLDGTARGVIRARQEVPSAAAPAPLLITPPELPAAPSGLSAAETPSSPAPSSTKQDVEESPVSQARPSLTFSVSETPTAEPPAYPPDGKWGSQPLIVQTRVDTPAAADLNMEAPEAPVSTRPPAYERSPDAAVPVAQPSSRADPVPPAELNESAAASPEVHEWSANEVPVEPVIAFPRYGEMSAMPPQAPAAATTWPADERAAGIPPTAYRSIPRGTTPIVSWDSLEGRWPELLPLDEPPEADENSLLGVWKRRERLDQEQRGIGWSELHS